MFTIKSDKKRKEICVVDDNIFTCKRIRNYLKDTDYLVSDALSSFIDLETEINTKQPDLLIVNHKFCEGEKLLSKLDLPVIILDQNKKNKPCNSLQNTDYLYEPFNKDELVYLLDFNFKIKENSLYVKHVKKETRESIIIEECGTRAYNFIKEYVDIFADKSIIISTTSRFNLKFYSKEEFNALVNLQRVNDIRYLNKFFETINELLPVNGLFIGCAETKRLRKKRIFKKYLPILNYIYYFFDFILKRVFPKLKFTKKIYFAITNGRNRVLSHPEILGRLYSCGFELVKEKNINMLYYFAVRKIKKPTYDKKPTYGPLIKIRRIGKNGKKINVYKFRTMHPYSEYIQEYVYKENKLQKGGKFKNDFRITTLGKFLRKTWIDELPMIYNLLKGDLKLVGVRPLSNHYFSLYPEEFKKFRMTFKPGLIPPFYKDLPKTLDEIIESERNYLNQYAKNPLWTDIKYFFAAMYNIIFKRARSK